MTGISLWPKGLIGRMTIVFVGAMLFQFLSSIFLHDQVDRYTLREDHARRIAELLVVGDRLLAREDVYDRSEILSALSTRHLAVQVSPSPIPSQRRDVAEIKAQIVAWEPSLAGKDIRLTTERRGPTQRDDLVGAMRLSSGLWLHFRSTDIFGRWPLLYRTFGTVAILTITVVVFAAISTNALATPLRALAQAANHVGEGNVVRIFEHGPRDLNGVARAFNTMQERIARLIAERSLALAAVSHDLRTPLTRLRLRADLIADPHQRQEITDDLIEMQTMLDSALAIMKGESDPEEPRLVDLVALTTTLVDAEADAGRAVSYAGPDSVVVEARPVTLKRALGNLVENGLKYGGRVHVSLEADDSEVRIIVDDEGPGIPDAKLPIVTEPFVRLDDARKRDTPGLGLGLYITSRIVKRERGELRLSNRPEGGLRAEIILPGART